MPSSFRGKFKCLHLNHVSYTRSILTLLILYSSQVPDHIACLVVHVSGPRIGAAMYSLGECIGLAGERSTMYLKTESLIPAVL